MGNLVPGPNQKQTNQNMKSGNKINIGRIGGIQDRLNRAQEEEDGLRDTATNRYNEMYEKSKNPGSNPAHGIYEEFSRTGGWDPERVKNVDGDIAGFRGLADYGADWMENGGWSDEDKSNFRGRTSAQVPAFYNNLKTEMARQNRVTGGGVGYSGQSRALARDASRGSADAIRDSEIDLSDSIRQGKLAGAGIRSGALRDSSGLEMRLAESMREGREFGATGLDDLSRYGDRLGMDSIDGLMDIYKSVPGRERMYNDQLGDWSDREYDQNMGYADRRDRTTNNWIQRLQQILNAAGTGARMIAGGGRSGAPTGGQ